MAKLIYRKFCIAFQYMRLYKWCLWMIFLYAAVFVGALIWYITLPEVRWKPGDNVHTVLWWTPNVPPGYKGERHCGLYLCQFTANRKLLPYAKAVLFYASDMRTDDWPLPRQPKQIWALLHDESPRNVPFIAHEVVLRHFNFTSTFSRYSTLPLTTQYLPSVGELVSRKYMGTDNNVQDTASVAFMQSDCDTMSSRENYVKELMRHIRIDSYGRCLKNRDLPESLEKDYLNNLYSPELMRFLRKYKFIIAYENGVCNDYITEKFWRPLLIGVIPIYFGSPTIRDWLPNNKSAILIDDFAGPKELAAFVEALVDNSTEYKSYLQHKRHKTSISQAVQNRLLLDSMLAREYPQGGLDIFSAFECHVCGKMLNIREQMADGRHYECPMPLRYPRMERQYENHWENIMEVGSCQAVVLDKLWQRNRNFTRKQFDAFVNMKLQSGKCSGEVKWNDDS